MPFPPHAPKPVGSLTLVALAAFPIWEWDDEGEGQDETWIRPVDARTVPKGSYTLVAAGFRAACGREFEGNVAVSRLGEAADVFNGVIHEGESFYLIPGPELAFFDRAMADLLNGLGLSESDLFPVSYTLRVPFEGEFACRSGILKGRKTGINQTVKRQMTFW